MKKENIKIIIALCGLAIASVGLINNPVGVYFTPISEALGIKRGTVALYSTIFNITTAVFATIYVRKLNNKNFKIFLIILSILTGLGTIAFALAESIIVIFALALLTGAFNAIFGMTNISVMINCNFKDNIGSLSSFIFLFCGIAGMIASPVFNAIILKYGYKMCYIVNGILIIIFNIPAYFTDIKYETKDKEKGETKYPVKTLILYTIANSIFCYISAMPQHFIGMAIEKGYDSTLGSNILSMCMFGNILIKIFIGKVTDIKGAKFSITFIELCNIVASIIFIFFKNKYILLICGLLMGFNYALTSVGNLALARELFKTNFNDCFSKACLCGTIVQGLAVAIMGYIYDFTHSYLPVLFISIIFDIMALCITIYLDKNKGNQY